MVDVRSILQRSSTVVTKEATSIQQLITNSRGDRFLDDEVRACTVRILTTPQSHFFILFFATKLVSPLPKGTCEVWLAHGPRALIYAYNLDACFSAS
jgi:hypothetical protein